jgi:hypothetical protein
MWTHCSVTCGGELLELLDESDDRNVPDETEDDCDTEPDQISEV